MFKPITGVTWRDKLRDIQRLRDDEKEVSEYAPNMINTFHHRVQNEIDRVSPVIIRGVVDEYQKTIANVKDRQRWMDTYRQQEAARWDFVKLAGERQALLSMIDEINKTDGVAFGGQDRAGRLLALWDECITSGDLHRIRAASEIFAGLSDRAVVDLIVEAKQKSSEIRTTPDIERSAEKLDAAIGELLEKRSELRAVALNLGEGDPVIGLSGASELTRNYRQVGIERGGIVIRDPSDPEVTGISPVGMVDSEVSNA